MAYKGLHLVKVQNDTYRIMNGNHERVGIITYNKDWKLRPGSVRRFPLHFYSDPLNLLVIITLTFWKEPK